MTDKFSAALKFTLNNEGGYSNVKGDRGGMTNMGVTASTLSRARAQGIVRQRDVKALTRAEAERIYKYLYWIPSRADDLPLPLCVIYFDCVINHGVGGGGKLLQKAINALNPAAQLKTDGAVGSLTLHAFHTLPQNITPVQVADALIGERIKKYQAIVAANPTQSKFLKGWLNRAERCRRYVHNG